MPSSGVTRSIKVPADIMASINGMTASTKGRIMSPEVLATIKAARATGLSWSKVAMIVKKHHKGPWALSQAALQLRNKKEEWGL